jgi:hypothetical protein
MNTRHFVAAFALATLSSTSWATGLATCDCGPKSQWQPVAKLEEQLKTKAWTVRRVEEDGGCNEVYALDEKGTRGEFYFHPLALEPVPTKRP